MNEPYDVVALSTEERDRLEHVYADLLSLSECRVPAVRSAARAALAQIAQALNGQGIAFELYTRELSQ